MAWIKLDDGFFRNPKIVSISPESKLIYIAGLCYAGAALTDGFIPKNVVKILASEANVSAPTKRAKELVDAGLWVEDPRGYNVHDYLQHNTSASDVLAKREAARKRMEAKRAGSSQEVRANTERTSQEVREPETEAETEVEKNIGADAPVAPPDGTLRDIKGGRKTAPKAKPLPENGPAQQIVKAYCAAIGIERPVNYGKAVGQAKQLADAGITPMEIPQIVKWLQGQKWVDGAVDLGLVLNQADKWQAVKNKPAPIRRHVV